MLGMEAVAERMADYLVSHHPAMPRACKTSQSFVTARCLENSLHGYMMTMVPGLGKTMASI